MTFKGAKGMVIKEIGAGSGEVGITTDDFMMKMLIALVEENDSLKARIEALESV